jgi:hypoxanthine phosphoribosyltransferase
VDTGLTLTYLQEILRARAPRNLRTACLLNKPSRRKVDVKVEYIGFTIEDKFVVGYGLDYGERYRSLPHIAVIGDAPGAD